MKFNKLFIIIGLITVAAPFCLFGEGFSTHRLVIALEEQEGTGQNLSNAITSEVYALIIQKSSPFIFPLTLWDKFIIGRNLVEDAKKLSFIELEQKYNTLRSSLLGIDYELFLQALRLTIDSLEAYKKGKIQRGKEVSATLKETLAKTSSPAFSKFFISESILASKIPFNKDDWHGSILNNRFLLLIPKKYAKKMEPNLGLNIDLSSLPSTLLNLPSVFNQFETLIQYDQSKNSLGKDLLKTLGLIFKQEKFDNNTPRWAIYLSGHGMSDLESINWTNSEDSLKAEELRESIKNYSKIIAEDTQDLEVAEKEYKNWNKIRAFILKKYHKNFIEEIKDSLEKNQQELTKKTNEFDKLIRKQFSSNVFSNREIILKREPSIAGLTIDEFKSLLSYLSKKINTTAFIYSSCYASGSNISKVYNQDQKTLFTEKHPFVIASAGISETTVGIFAINNFAHYPPDETDEDFESYKNTTVKALIDFNSFFSMLEQDDPISWEKLLNLVFFYIDFPQNTPLIKFPGTEWFTVPNLQEKVISIGSVMAATRDPGKALVIKNQDSILLYAYNIPFPLKYEKKELKEYGLTKPPLIISMIPGKSYQTFKSINAPTYKASAILQSFFNFKDIQSTKIFFIDEIEVINDILPEFHGKTIHLKDVYILQYQDSGFAKELFGFRAPVFRNNNIICFTTNEKPYGWLWPSERDIFISEEPQHKGKDYGILNSYEKTIKNYINLLKERNLISSAKNENSFSEENKAKLIEILKKKSRDIKTIK